MPLQGIVFEVDGEVVDQPKVIEWARSRRERRGVRWPTVAVVGVELGPPADRGWPAIELCLPASWPGLELERPELLAMAAAGLGCFMRDLVLVTAGHTTLARVADEVGCRTLVVGSLDGISDALASIEQADDSAVGRVGLGPHEAPWPDDGRLDPELLAGGDRRNVVDRYRYWRESAIIADLDARRVPLHVAVENWQHDLNIGTVVRNANAFNVAGVHIVGKRRWNRRGAMATDRYLTVTHHPSVPAFDEWAHAASLPVVGIDNVAGATALETADLPSPAVMVFGQEGPGLSADMVAVCSELCAITQDGSTRSLNAGVASGIALYAWTLAHRPRAG